MSIASLPSLCDCWFEHGAPNIRKCNFDQSDWPRANGSNLQKASNNHNYYCIKSNNSRKKPNKSNRNADRLSSLLRLGIAFFCLVSNPSLDSTLLSTNLVPIRCVAALPNRINIGAIFDVDRRDHEIAFQLAIRRINADRVILPNATLVPKIERIVKHDIFHADKKVCGLLRTGVVAIFDPLNEYASHHLQSICDAMNIPHIEARWDFSQKKTNHSINLFPRPSVLTRAYVELVKAWNWRQFVIVYEEHEGLFRLQDFFKEAQAHNWRIKLYQFDRRKPYRETFLEIKRGDERHIILDVKNENLYQALKHAQQVGLITERHSYLITQLDLHTIDLEDFKFSEAQISAFSLVDDRTLEHKSLLAEWRKFYPNEYRAEYVSTDSALIYDAIRLLAAAIQHLDQSQSIEMTPVSCESATPWAYGSSLVNHMRPLTFGGITGVVKFNDLGFRSDIRLSIVTVRPNGLEEIGTWTEREPDVTKRLKLNRTWNVSYGQSVLQNKMLIITTALNSPYTMMKISKEPRTGNDQFEGYAIDLVAELAKLLHFRYQFRLLKNGAYGRPNTTGQWSGMLGELIRGEADLAVGDLTITSKRNAAVDFTYPFMNTGISILFKKPTKKVTSLFSFLSPFSNIVWIYVVCAYVGISFILFIVGRLSPYEWENRHPCRRDAQVLENDFSLTNSFWFTIGILMQQSSGLSPKAMSTRTIAAIWHFFTLIMIASYTANLVAFLTIEKIVYPIENAQDLADQTVIKYGCIGSGSTASFFAESNITTYKRMWAFMSKRPEVMMSSTEAGIKNVEKSDGTYAFLMESASIEYVVERNCNLTQIGGQLDSNGYGFATVKDSPYQRPLSAAILKLQESGALEILKKRWWKQRNGGGQCTGDSKKGSASATPLKVYNVGGVFVVLLGGLSFSLVVAIFEFVWRARNNQLQQESICKEMINDLKFAFLAQSSSVKIVKRKRDPTAAPATQSHDGVGGEMGVASIFAPTPTPQSFGLTGDCHHAIGIGPAMDYHANVHQYNLNRSHHNHFNNNNNNNSNFNSAKYRQTGSARIGNRASRQIAIPNKCRSTGNIRPGFNPVSARAGLTSSTGGGSCDDILRTLHSATNKITPIGYHLRQPHHRDSEQQ